MTQVSLMHEKQLRARRLVEKVEAAGGRVFLRGDGGVRVIMEPAVPIEIRNEVIELGAGLVDYLGDRETVVDADAPVLNSTPSPSPEEIDSDARKARMKAAQRRSYQGGAVNVFNTNQDGLTPLGKPNNYGDHVRRLAAAQRGQRPAGPRSWAPHPGTCHYKWNLFGDDGPTAE
jgi:hypothetical protein